MTTINIEGFADLKKQIQQTQSGLPEHSLDWNIYQGQLDLLNKVAVLFTTLVTDECSYKVPTTKQKLASTEVSNEVEVTVQDQETTISKDGEDIGQQG